MAPQIGFPGLAPRSRAHLCFTMVEGSNRRREEGDVSRGFRVPRATDWQGPIGFFVASPFPIWRRTHFPSTLNSFFSTPRAQRTQSFLHWGCRSTSPLRPLRARRWNGLWIPIATRMTGWGSRILTAARITADNEKAMGERNYSESRGRPHPSPLPRGRDSVNPTLSYKD